MKTASQLVNPIEYSDAYKIGKIDAEKENQYNNPFRYKRNTSLYDSIDGYDDGYYDNSPKHYFKDINNITPTSSDFKDENSVIEYLYMPLGRTIRHSYGTAYIENGIFNTECAKRNGITHWRILNY